MKKYLALALILNLIFSSVGFCGHYSQISEAISAPQDSKDGWVTVKSDATVATTNPYKPAAVSSPVTISMDGYTGVLVRAKYVSGSTLTTNPVIAVFGKRNGSWQILNDANGSRTSTLADTTSDVDNNTNAFTDSTQKIDALGSELVIVTVVTAAVASSGAVSIEATRY